MENGCLSCWVARPASLCVVSYTSLSSAVEQALPIAFPTRHLTILEPRDQEMGEHYVVHESFSTDFEDSNLWKGWSGSAATSELVRQTDRQLQKGREGGAE